MKLTLIALLFTFGALAFLILGLLGTIAVPLALGFLHLAGRPAALISSARWPLLFAAVMIALALVYRYGPSHTQPRWRWISWGSGVAAIGWLIISALFSWFVAGFGTFNATYGSLGAVIGFMTWLWLSATMILIGAQIDAQGAEHRRDESRGG